MCIWIDRKYLLLISPKLLLFKQKNDNLFSFRCPYCGDSNKNKTKTRGYIFCKDNSLIFKCHNCSIAHNFYTFIKDIDAEIAKEYIYESYKEKNNIRTVTKPKIVPNPPIFKKKDVLQLQTINDLSEDHDAYKYITSRKIPKKFYKELYYTDDFKSFINKIKPDYEDQHNPLFNNDKRIILPFRDLDGKIFTIQGRSLNPLSIRYITVKLTDELKIFGLDRIKRNEVIYVVEGGVDSLFIHNCIATADSNLSIAEQIFNKDNLVLIYDNEPRNTQLIKQIEKSVNENFTICLFPEYIKEKDINDMVINGYTKPHIMKLISMYSYSGIRLGLEFNRWRKV